MSDFAYLDAGLLEDGKPRRFDVDDVATAFCDAGIEVSGLELCSELLARTAAELGSGRAAAPVLEALAQSLGLAGPVLELLRRAAKEPLDADGLAALALHLLDIAERTALLVYLPELPGLIAKADRSGGAARQVGAARHLKG